ncbi:MAG: polyphenol oxidase family protein [Gemmatimonadaceae bacterium]|nr:polyphenol oxidase family protein [Gemmatimonadaceae bacterium]
MALPPRLEIVAFEDIGVRAFTTTRAAGDFNLSDPAVGGDARWQALQQALAAEGAPRLASAKQVHGTRVLIHAKPFEGWLRVDDADGHVMLGAGAAAVTIADCVPVFIAHPAGAVGMVHAGWRGVAGGILPEALRQFASQGYPVDELRVHLGPSICGRCYEVGVEVYEQLTGWETKRARQVDLRALLAEQAKQFGVAKWSASGECTRCDNGELFSHRAGDSGRQIACIYSAAD